MPSRGFTKAVRKDDDLSKRKVMTPEMLDFSTYIGRTLYAFKPEMKIAKSTVDVMNGILHDMFDKVLMEAATLARRTGKDVLTHNDVKTATRLVCYAQRTKTTICFVSNH